MKGARGFRTGKHGVSERTTGRFVVGSVNTWYRCTRSLPRRALAYKLQGSRIIIIIVHRDQPLSLSGSSATAQPMWGDSTTTNCTPYIPQQCRNYQTHFLLTSFHLSFRPLHCCIWKIAEPLGDSSRCLPLTRGLLSHSQPRRHQEHHLLQPFTERHGPRRPSRYRPLLALFCYINPASAPSLWRLVLILYLSRTSNCKRFANYYEDSRIFKQHN